ncbi:MAG TPA: hypothetical protein VGD20_02875, partial [Sphingopyxis sp.]
MLRALVTAVAIIVLGWVAGGQALLGRIDPALAIPLVAPPMLVLAWWQRAAPATDRRRATLLTLGFLAIAQALLALRLAGSTAWLQLLLVAIVGAVAAFAADALVRWRPRARLLASLAGLLLVAGWFGAGHALLAALYRAGAAPAEAPAATMLTGLPLRWSGGSG